MGWVSGNRHIERRLLRFGFDVLKSGSFIYVHQKQSSGECPVGVLYTSLSYAEWPMVSLHRWNFWHSEVLHIMRGASALLVSMDRALPEPQNVERATV